MCRSVFFHECKHSVFVPRTLKVQKDFNQPRNGVTDSCEPLCEWWKPNLCFLEKQQVSEPVSNLFSPQHLYTKIIEQISYHFHKLVLCMYNLWINKLFSKQENIY